MYLDLLVGIDLAVHYLDHLGTMVFKINYFENQKQPIKWFSLHSSLKNYQNNFNNEKSFNPGHNILELCNALVQVPFTRPKTKRDIYYKKFGLWVALKLAIWLKAYDPRREGNIRETSNFVGKIAKFEFIFQESKRLQ